MYKLKQTVFVLIVLLSAAGILWAAKDPAPGSKEDPLITKSYVDHLSAWQRVQLPAGGQLNMAEGTELVLVFSPESGVKVEADRAKLDKVFDLTLGMPLGDSAMLPGHHYICAASGEFQMKFASEAQVLIRGGA